MHSWAIVLSLVLNLVIAATIGCSSNKKSSGNGGDDGGGDGNLTVPDPPADGVAEDCGSVRMTQYTSSDSRWCGFDRNHSALPDFVRAGMTVAVAEPYNGSSYEGDPGEACGECWELTTEFARQLVMVHDLCPIEGNPICAGSYFHFDVANEVADVIDGGQWMGEAAVRRVPCPVTGNIYVHITSRNEWGYMQIAFFNHRYPIRTVEYRAADSDTWMPMERCLARWCLVGDKENFASGGPGGVFRLTSANGMVTEATEVLGYDIVEDSDFDLGTQFDEGDDSAGSCVFRVPTDVYDDAWGGIDGVTWDYNTWGSTSFSEVRDDCADGSASCLRFANFGDSGVHITYRHPFVHENFSSASLKLRIETGTGTVEVHPRSEEGRCEHGVSVDLSEEWTTATLDLASSCPGVDWLHGFTISWPSDNMTLYVDDIKLVE